MRYDKKFIFVHANDSWSQFRKCIFSDLLKDERSMVIESLIDPKSNFLRKIRRTHLNQKINSWIDLPFKKMWYTLEKIQWNDNTDYYVVFVDGPYRLNRKYLNLLKRKHHIHYVMLLLNSNIPPHGDRIIESLNTIQFDYIFTFDIGDAKQYDFIFTDNIYSKMTVCNHLNYSYDLYYIGGNNGRLEMAHGIYDCLKKAEVKQLFRITGVTSEQMIYKNEIIYNNFIEYKQSVEELIMSNCILELERENDNRNCATLRYYEAVCYNKKLLTNNRNVVNLPFYHPDYMRIFEKPEDIDWEWVKERIPVDYHYDGRFSPTHLIDKILELEEERETRENAEAKTD